MLASFLSYCSVTFLQPPLNGNKRQQCPDDQANCNAPDHPADKAGVVFGMPGFQPGLDVRSEFFLLGRIEHHAANCDFDIHGGST